MKKDIFVSVIVAISDKVDYGNYIHHLSLTLKNLYSYHEIILVECFEPSFSIINLDKLLSEVDNIRYVKLSESTFNYEKLVAFGLEHSIGDFIVTFDLINDPADEIDNFISKCMNGWDIVIGDAVNYPQSRSFLYLSVKVRQFINRVNKIKSSSLGTTLKCFSRRALNAISEKNINEGKLHLKINNSGFEVNKIRYEFSSTFQIPRKTICSEFKRGVNELINSSNGFILKGLKITLIIYASILFSYFILYWFNYISETKLVILNHIMTQILLILFLGLYIRHLSVINKVEKVISLVYEKNSSVMNNDCLNVLYDSEMQIHNNVQTGRNK